MADNIYLGTAEKYGKYITAAARDTGLDPNVILSVLMTESAGDTTATSRTGARGLMQLMPGTAVEVAKSLGYDKYKDEADLMNQLHTKPGLNILFGSKYFKDRLDEAGGDVAKAYVGYHDGPDSETFLTGQGFGPELSLGLDSLNTHLNNLGYGKPKAAPAQTSGAEKLKDVMSGYKGPSIGDMTALVASGPYKSPRPGVDYSPKMYNERTQGVIDPQFTIGSGELGLGGARDYNPESFVDAGGRELIRQASLGAFDPMEGMPEGVGPAARWGRGIYGAVGTAIPFAISGGATAPLRGAVVGYNTGRGALLAGRAAQTAAQFGLIGGSREAIRQAKGGGGEGGAPMTAADRAKAVASEVGKEALIGTALAGWGALPPVQTLARTGVGSVIANAIPLAVMDVGQSLINHEPIDPKAVLERTAQTSIGLGLGNKMTESIVPESWRMTPGERATEKARVIAREELAREQAQEAQSRLPVPVSEPYSGQAADYGPTLRAAQAWSEALPPTQELYDQQRRPVTTRRALPPVATEGGVPAEPRVLPAETTPPTLAVDPAEIRQMADDVMAEAVRSGNPRMAGVADRLQAAAQRAADEIPRRELAPPETIPPKWDASTPEQPVAPGTLVEPRGNPMPTVSTPAPAGERPVILDQFGRPAKGRRRGSRAAADVPVNWSPSPEPIPEPGKRSRIVAPGQQPGTGEVATPRNPRRARDIQTFDLFGATVEGGKLAGELGKKAGEAISERARRAKAKAAEREAAAIRAEADRIKAEMRGGAPEPGKPGATPTTPLAVTAHAQDKTAQLLADRISGKITDEQLTAGLQEVGVAPTPDVKQQLQDVGIGKLGGWGRSERMGGLDRRRQLRQLTTTEKGGSRFNDAITKNTLRLWELAERAGDAVQTGLATRMADILQTHGIGRKSQMNTDLSRISEAATDTGLHPLELLAPAPADAKPAEIAYRARVQDIAKRSEDWGRLIKAFDAVQAEYRKMGRMRNEIHRAVGAEPFDMRKYYSPRIERKYSLTGKGQKGLRAKAAESRRALEQLSRPIPESRRGIGTETINDVWSAREQRRGEPLLDESRRSYDMYEQANSYIQDTARVLGNSVALKRAKLVVQEIRNAAKPYEDPGTRENPNPNYDPAKANEIHIAADALEAIANYGYAGKRYGIQGAWEKGLKSTRPGMLAYRAEQAMTTAFNYSRYMGNIRFLTTTQWLAPLMVASQGKVTLPMLKDALREVNTERLGKEWAASYTNYAKSKRQGNPLHEGRLDEAGMATPLERAGRSAARRGRDIAVNVAEAPTSKIESITGRLTYAIAEQIALRAGPKLGWTPQDYLDFKSDTVGLTSQYFDKINRAPLLSTPILKAAYPAQGFSFDALNSLIFGAKGMSGAETVQSRGQRAEKVGATIAALVAGATVQSLIRSNKKDEGLVGDIAINAVGSAIPGVPSFLGIGDARGMPYQAQAVKTYLKDIPEMVGKGEYGRAAGAVAGETVPGGVQIKRVVEANRMIEKGIIPKREALMAQTWGWETTPSGKEYLRKINSKGKSKSRRRRGSKVVPR